MKQLNFLICKIVLLAGFVVCGAFSASAQQPVKQAESVSTVKPNATEAVAYSSPEKLLQGRVAGVKVTSSDASPTGAVNVHIRGLNSLRANSEPLYILDGVILNPVQLNTNKALFEEARDYEMLQNTLANINPLDIESIQVLKDISATAIYGSMGANGVVIINTKLGKTKNAVVQWRSSVKISTPYKKINMLGFDEFLKFQRQAGHSVVSSIQPAQSWQDKAFETAVSQDHHISVSGNEEGTRYYMAFGYRDINGILANSDLQTMNLTMRMDKKLTNFMHIGVGLVMSRETNKITSGVSNFQPTATTQLLTGMPFLAASPVQNYESWVKGYEDKGKEYRVTPSFYTTLTFAKWLKLKVNMGVDYRDLKRQRWYGNELELGAERNGLGSMALLHSMRYNADAILTFEKIFGGHYLSVSAGVAINGTTREQSSQYGYDFHNQALKGGGLNFAVEKGPARVYNMDDFMKSGLAMVSYAYKGKYLVSGSVRADNVRPFDNKKYKVFPAGNAAWIITEEPFMKNQKVISNLKLRFGWGKAGTHVRDNYDMMPYYYTGSDYPKYEPHVDEGVVKWQPYDPHYNKILWRTTSEEYNAGLDFALFKNRLRGSVSLYHKETDDVLKLVYMNANRAQYNTFESSGKLRNQGIEIELEGVVLKNKDWSWSVGGNITFNRGKVVEAPAAYLSSQTGSMNGIPIYTNASINGAAPSSFWGLMAQGVVKSEHMAAAPPYNGYRLAEGDIKFIDVNGDRNVTNDDKTVIGNPNPKFYGGLYTTVTYKRFTLDLLFNGSYGNEILNLNLLNEENVAGYNNIRSEAYRQAYSSRNTNTQYPRINAIGLDEVSSRLIENGSFLRLQNVSLSYDIPLGKVKKNWIKSLGVSFTANNLFVISKYKGWDPEVNSFANDITRYGVDYGSYPTARSFIIGVSATF